MIIKTLLAALAVTFTAQASPAFDYNCHYKNKSQICDVFLSDEIFKPEVYRDLHVKILTMTENDLIFLHLVGDGGDVGGALYLYNFLKGSSVKKVVVIDGVVESAHAFLAFSFGKPAINSEGFAMFHASSLTNMARHLCTKEGFDRGLPISEKCRKNVTTISEMSNKIFLDVLKDVLTKDEIQKFLKGEDIIIDFKELNKRLGGLK